MTQHLKTVPRAVGAAAEAALAARGDEAWLRRVFSQQRVPMLLVDDERRYVDVNLALRLAFRLSLDQIRSLRIEDLTAPERLPIMERVWSRLTDSGCVAGTGPMVAPSGNRLEVVYCALANVLPGLHVGAVAPAAWTEEEFGGLPIDVPAPPAAPLTPRELEVLLHSADGSSGPEIADELVISLGTVRKHFENVYKKLRVSDRPAAVAKALRLGLID
jgi:DNA-binding CsgD family transcriptional regulator